MKAYYEVSRALEKAEARVADLNDALTDVYNVLTLDEPSLDEALEIIEVAQDAPTPSVSETEEKTNAER